MKEKMAIVNKLIANGYALFNETPEQFAARFDKATLEMFLKSFTKWQDKT